MANNLTEVTKINMRTVGSVAVGVALFGAAVWAIRSLPNNALTTPVKAAAAVATNTAPAAGNNGGAS